MTCTEQLITPIVYISGPMSNYPYYNQALFELGERFARHLGWEVVNPHTKDVDEGVTVCPVGTPLSDDHYNERLKADLSAIDHCDAIWMLPGWPESRGANIELGHARNTGKKVFLVSPTDLRSCAE